MIIKIYSRIIYAYMKLMPAIALSKLMLSFIFAKIRRLLQLKRICEGFFLSFVHISFIIQLSRAEGCDSINRLSPDTFGCLSQAMTWNSNVIGCSLFYVQCIEVRGDCWFFVNIGGIVDITVYKTYQIMYWSSHCFMCSK